MRSLAVAVALALTIPSLAAAQGSAAPKAKPAVTGKTAPDATAGSNRLEADRDKARLAAEARQREWDRKMKSLTRSICSGAKGC